MSAKSAESVEATRSAALPAEEPAPPSQAANGRRRPTISGKPEVIAIPGVFVVVVLAWHWAVELGDIPQYILPKPLDVWHDLVELLGGPLFWYNWRITLQELLIGFVAGAAVALVIGTAIAQVRLLEKSLMPYVVAFQAVPVIALAPLFIIWFGFGLTSKIIISAIVAFFPILVNVIQGLRSSDKAQLEMLRSFGASRWQVFLRAKVPNALPFVFTGLDIGIVFALIGAIVGEFVGSDAGIGYLVLQANFQFDISGMFALLIVLSVTGIILHLIVRGIHARVVFWHGEGR